jgi:RNA polymerase primary sigma factor
VEFRYGLKDGVVYSLQAVGEMYGVTGERIRQIEARALGKLRRLARSRPRGTTRLSQAA